MFISMVLVQPLKYPVTYSEHGDWKRILISGAAVWECHMSG
jgi:hypothetical protein